MGELLFAEAIHIQKQSKIDAARITQKSGNAKRGAETALSQFSASLSTTRQLDAAGSQIGDLTGNATRLIDASTRGTLQARLAVAEELGAAAAQSGAAGVGGASVETHNETVRLQAAIMEAGNAATTDSQLYSIGQQKGNALRSAVGSIDNNVYRANIDYTQFVDHKQTSMFERVVGIGLTAAATVYGGPQAGAAVMGVFEARQASRNGDYATASGAITGAIKNGVSAAQSYSATHGDSPKGTTTASNAGDPFSGDVNNINKFSFGKPTGYGSGSITIK